MALGEPHFIEIKGVTFCGDSKGSGISMKSVPFHSEVVEFAQQFVGVLEEDPVTAGSYAVACEHQHSCCVLIAHTRYRRNGQWCTHIDYDKFNAAWRKWREQETTSKERDASLAAGGESRPSPANAMDVLSYAAPTPVPLVSCVVCPVSNKLCLRMSVVVE